MLNRQRSKIDILKTPDIYRGHMRPRRIQGLSKRVDAAARTEPVLDHLLVECVGAQPFFGSEQAQTFPRNKPKK